jgi:hypothetical protein
MFSLVPLVCQWESNPKLQGGWCKTEPPAHRKSGAHNACIRELLQEVNAHGKAAKRMKLLTIEKESRLGTLWDQEQCFNKADCRNKADSLCQ